MDLIIKMTSLHFIPTNVNEASASICYQIFLDRNLSNDKFVIDSMDSLVIWSFIILNVVVRSNHPIRPKEA